MKHILIGDLDHTMPLSFRCIDGPCRGYRVTNERQAARHCIYLPLDGSVDIVSESDPEFPALRYACYELVCMQIGNRRYKVYRLNRSKSEF